MRPLCALGACQPRGMLMPSTDLSQLVGFTQHGILGVSFFHGRRVILDFPGKQLGFEPSRPVTSER